MHKSVCCKDMNKDIKKREYNILVNSNTIKSYLRHNDN